MKENTITKEHQVVILPTDKKGAIVKLIKTPYKNYGTIGMIANNHPMKKDNYWEPQHLYFISDELIKEGDWCINKNRDTLYQLNNITTSRAGVEFWDKVIATTNPDLWWKDTPMGQEYPGISKIDTTFTEAYVREQGKIDTVLLEYETVCPDKIEGCTGLHKYEQLKLKSNGSVIVHPVKEKMYSREEVIEKIRIFGSSCTPNVITEEWIKQNL